MPLRHRRPRGLARWPPRFRPARRSRGGLAERLFPPSAPSLRHAKVAPQIIKGYQKASQLAIAKLLEMAVDLKEHTPEARADPPQRDRLSRLGFLGLGSRPILFARGHFLL